MLGRAIQLLARRILLSGYWMESEPTIRWTGSENSAWWEVLDSVKFRSAYLLVTAKMSSGAWFTQSCIAMMIVWGLINPKKLPADNPVTDCYTIAGKQHQDVPSRRTYEDVLKLLPEDLVDNAVNMFAMQSKGCNGPILCLQVPLDKERNGLCYGIEAAERWTFRR